MSLPPFHPPAEVPVGRLLDFSDRRVLVTGARKGIGQGIAERFAEAGADVAVHVRTPADGHASVAAVEAHHRRAVVAAADLSNATALEAAIDAVEVALGPLDVLVNNAGAYPIQPLLELSAEAFDEVVRANLGTAFRATRALAERWRKRGQPGVVVNVSSIESTRPAVGHVHYASAKAGLDMLTRAAAVELGPDGIRVNAVAPGLVHYPELPKLWPEGVDRYRARSPLGREGHRREIADACLFLASPAATWVTGAVLVVDGGVSAAPHF